MIIRINNMEYKDYTQEDWDKLDNKDWSKLLQEQPQFKKFKK